MIHAWQAYNWPGLLGGGLQFGATAGWDRDPIQLNVNYPEQPPWPEMPALPEGVQGGLVVQPIAPTFSLSILTTIQNTADRQKVSRKQTYKVKASSDDITPDFLSSKLVAGEDMDLTVLNPGANETIQINNTMPELDEMVKASADDPTTGYLDAKVKNSIEVNSDDLQLVGDADAPGNTYYYGTNAEGAKGWHTFVVTDELVKVSANDTTPDFLLAKLVAGTGISITEVSDGGDEDARISWDYAAIAGYDAGKTQVLTHVTGTLTWVDTVVC